MARHNRAFWQQTRLSSHRYRHCQTPPVQATLLEAYAGAAGAAAAETFADDLRASPPAPGPRRRQPRRRRPRTQPTVVAAAEHHNDSDSAHTQVPECPAQALASPGQWEQLDAGDLAEEFRHPAPTLQDAPPFMRGAVRSAFTQALSELRAAAAAGPAASQANAARAARAWKLFLLVPRMLLTRATQQGSQGRAELLSRAAAFQRGEWTQLIRSARPSRQRSSAHKQELPPDEVSERKRHNACAKVRQGELSRACQVLRHGGHVAGAHPSRAATSATTLANTGRTPGI